MLAVDNSGESPGLTGHTPRQVANNVSGKSEGSCHKCVPFYSFIRHFMELQPNVVLLTSHSQFLTFTPLFTVSLPHFLFLSPSFSSCCEMTQLGWPWLIRAHPRGGRMELLGLYGFSSHYVDF